ncbi:Importin-4 [Hondaea fermentalgiana]|uniref:Importin-4 n=1 Tax=Hondaea fermentalgiana TaxID=2315210 RepID=A0A2R5GFK1_9STRA|nr:Importin-4 [Hondaea fermentalgiana]|eukprot:GBG26624.1 Importin-4 [Hondaea fermentalgiana]
MADDAQTQQLEQVLLRINVPNTEVVKEAEAQVRQALRRREFVVAMLKLLRFSQHVAVRQLCAVLLRLRLGEVWSSLAPEVRVEAKQFLLEALAAEPERIVSLNTTYVVSAVGKREMREAGIQGWPELLQFLQQLAQSQAPQQQELAMRLFFALTETVGTVFQPHFADLRQLYGGLLQNAQDSRVRVAALKAAGALVEFLSTGEDVLVFRDLVPLIVQGLEANYRDEAVAIQVLDVLNQLAESPVPILNKSVKNLVQVLLAILRSSDEEVESGIKDAAGVTLATVMACKSRFIVKHSLVSPILETSIHVLAAEYPRFVSTISHQELSQAQLMQMQQDQQAGDHGEGDESDEELGAGQLGPRLISALTNSVASRHVLSPIVTVAFEHLARQEAAQGSNAVPNQWLGLSLLIHSTAGLSEEYAKTEVLETMLQRVVPIAQSSSSAILRTTALMCLTEWVEYLAPNIWIYMPQLLPHAVQLLGDQSVVVRSCACDLIELISDDIDEDILAPYLTSLVRNLLTLAVNGVNVSIQSTALSALSSVMVTAGPAFMPYFDDACRVLGQLSSLEDEPLLQVRGYATAAYGSLALACSRPDENRNGETNLARFSPLVTDLLAKASDGLDFEDMELNRLTYAMLGNLASAFEEQVEPCVDQMAEILVLALYIDDSIELNVQDPEGVLVPDSVRNKFGADLDEGDGADDEGLANGADDDDDDVGDGAALGVRYEYSVRMEVIEAKQAALTALGQLVENAPSSKLPVFLDASLDACIRMLSHVHEETKACAFETITQILGGYAQAYPLPPLNEEAQEEAVQWAETSFREVDPGQRWRVGLPARYEVDSKTMGVIETKLKPNWFEVIATERDKAVVASALTMMEKMVASFGPVAVASDLESVLNVCVQVLQGKATCQRLDHLDFDDDDDDNESAGRGAGAAFDDGDDDENGAGRSGVSLMEAVCDLLGMLGQAVGPAFKSYAGPVVGALLHKAKQGGAPGAATGAITPRQVTICGALAEITDGLGPGGCAPFARELIMYAVPLLSCELALARRNAAFLLGTAVALAGSTLQSDGETLMKLLQALEPLLGEAAEVDRAAAEARAEDRSLPFEITDVQAVVDNACGAVARLLMRADPGVLPVERIFPSLLQMLPLRFDLSENFAVCACMRMCVQSSDAGVQAQVRSHLGALVSAMAQTLVAMDDEDAVSQLLAKRQVVQLFQALLAQDKDQTMRLIASLPADQAAQVQAL